MPDLLMLNIGTGHGSTEKELITSKLREWSRYADIGCVGNHMRGGTGDSGAHGRKKDNISIKTPKNGGWTVTGEGQSTAATGMLDQTKAYVKLIKDLHENHGGVRNLYILGHSRGCILSLRVAAFIYEKISTIKAHLFLIDPVKRMSRGTDFYNRQIHGNVDDIQIVAMEDENTAGGSFFSLMKVTKKTGKKVSEVSGDHYIRMPGCHGTATQVDGHPIGQTTAQLALRFFGDRHNVPFTAAIPTNASLNSSYMKINTVNPVVQGKRTVNDGSTMKTSKFGARDLSSIKENNWQGSGFFINQHHFDVFSTQFSRFFVDAVYSSVIDGHPPYDDAHMTARLGVEYGQWKMKDTNGFAAMKKLKAAHARLKAHCGISD